MSRRILAAAVVVSAILATSIAAEDWSAWQGPNHNGISNDTGLKLDALSTKVWRKKTGVGYSSVTIADNNVIALGNINKEDVISCYDASTGKAKWTLCIRMLARERI